jgi:ABC-type multidrug transport system fused ATPase/permease subunit
VCLLLRASSVFALLDFSLSLSRAHTQFAFLGAISLLFSMAVVARPSMPAAMQSCGISKFQLQKQQQEQLGSLRMVQLLPMTSVRRCGSKKEERSQAGWRDSRQRMKMYISAAVSVNSGEFISASLKNLVGLSSFGPAVWPRVLDVLAAIVSQRTLLRLLFCGYISWTWDE